MNESAKPRCTFCLDEIPDSKKHRDHIPGRQFFPDPKPSTPQLITVPSCRKCQRRFKKAEDYARSLLCFGNAGVSEAGKKLWKQKLTSTYKKDRGLRALIARAIRYVNVTTPEGLWAGRRMVIQPDWSRLRPFVEKVVRGLYVFEFDEPLSADADVDVPRAFGEDFSGRNPYDSVVLDGKRGWSGVFEYKCWRAVTKQSFSVWRLLFYGENILYATTHDKGDRGLSGVTWDEPILFTPSRG